MLGPFVALALLLSSCAASVPASAIRVRDGDWQYALASKDIGIITIAGQTPQPGQKSAQIEVVNLGSETAQFDATIVIRGAGEDQTGFIAGTVRSGWSAMVVIPYDSRGSAWRFGVRRTSGEILWLE